MTQSPTPPRKPPTSWQRFLNMLGGWSGSLVYGSGVTGMLGLYYALFKAGDITVLPRMLKFVGMMFTPWFVFGYSLTRRILPDRPVNRTGNLLLPMVEAWLAVATMSILLSLKLEVADHYLNTGLLALQLFSSVLVGRLIVRRVFRH